MIGDWKITKAQQAEILALYEKLGWSLADLERDLGRPLQDFYWAQAVSVISGAEEILNNPKQWIKL